jgi:hypothetical protein
MSDGGCQAHLGSIIRHVAFFWIADSIHPQYRTWARTNGRRRVCDRKCRTKIGPSGNSRTISSQGISLIPMRSNLQLWLTKASVLRQVAEPRSLEADTKRKTSSPGGFFFTLPPSPVDADFEHHDALVSESITDSRSYLDFTAPVTPFSSS